MNRPINVKLLKALQQALGDHVVLTGERIPAKARSDKSRIGHHSPMIYIRPRSVEHISSALRLCNTYCSSVVVQGGMTGLAGGANPERKDVVIAMDLLAGIEEIDTAAGTMTVLAGTVLEVAQKAAEDSGFLLPIDLGARGSCQIGGNLATNAGGVRVINHGVTRDNVLGLQAVLADGTVISSLNRVQKNNTGYDLKQLFIGSEGTLGIITRAVLKLQPLPVHRATALCALSSYEDVVALLRHARKSLMGLSAFELMWETFFRFNCEAENIKAFEADYPFTVIIEQSGETIGLEEFLSAMLEEGLLDDALIAQSEKERDRFWKIREGLSLGKLPNLIEYDVSLPIGALNLYAEEVIKALETEFPGIHVSIFGHVADSNIHLCISARQLNVIAKNRINTIVYDGVRKHQGSISAEHGIGLLKRDYLAYSRSPEELELMRRIKQALDPQCILNPGKIFLA
ncbi:FAD-binding oxidoreductase [Bradyrhizobium sp. CCGE-LA001]|uniref:FAD-binding oxidoreductase n=1 Tax=Bradyrhizobium sp. CCGE-LA001 TaxID=1223566 RepID=UPI0002E8769C|nr:FAD-binding oxidoreductase [Bradyrhizobium sp. CCGE-LA001]AMA59999.1 FAD-linked oxidase [Bradyrhizobium sp. CCGE-LA001]